jgi:hypothetical protein
LLIWGSALPRKIRICACLNVGYDRRCILCSHLQRKSGFRPSGEIIVDSRMARHPPFSVTVMDKVDKYTIPP